MTDTDVPQAFRNCCTAEITCDERGEECALTVRCQLMDRYTGQPVSFEKTIALQPLVKFIHHQLLAWHRDAHGRDVDISGLGSFLSKAKDAAKRIASSSGIKSVYNQVKKVAAPVLKAAAKELPGGEAALALATKTYQTVAKARQGDAKALAEIKNVASKALAGNELAQKMMSTAKTLNVMQDIKEGKNAPEMAHRVSEIEAILRPLWQPPRGPQGGIAVSGDMDLDFDDITGLSLRSIASKAKWAVPGYAAYRGAKAIASKARGSKPARPSPRKGFAPTARKKPVPPPRTIGPHPSAMVTPTAALPPPPIEEAPEVLDEMAYAMEEDGYSPEEIDYAIEETVSGWKEWFYHRPYRHVAQAALQGDIGASGTLRALYSNGMDTILSRFSS